MGVCIYSIVFGPETLSLEFVMVLCLRPGSVYSGPYLDSQLSWLYQVHAYGEHNVMPGPLGHYSLIISFSSTSLIIFL